MATALQRVQDCVESLMKIGHADLNAAVWKAVEAHYVAVGRARNMKTPKSRQTAEDRCNEKFLAAIKFILEKHLPRAHRPAGLLASFERCLGDTEVLYQNLSMALYEGEGWEEEDLAAEESEDDRDEGFDHDEGKDGLASELKPLFGLRVLDVRVTYTEADTTSVGPPLPPLLAGKEATAMPAFDVDRTVILGNMPLQATAEDVQAALAPCGTLRSLEICTEWKHWLYGHDAVERPLEDPPEDLPENLDRNDIDDDENEEEHIPEHIASPPPFSVAYAIAQFETFEAHRRACRQHIQIFGVLMREDRLQKATAQKAAKWKKVSRPAFPQPAACKRALLLHGVPWRLGVPTLLPEIAGPLAGIGCGCRLRIANSSALGVPPLEIEITPDGRAVRHMPTRPVEGRSYPTSARIGAVVLRFDSFERAHSARKRLQGMSLGGKTITCGFPPWRPLCCQVDSTGHPLPEAVMVDLPLSGRSARYDAVGDDPVLHYSMPMLEAADAHSKDCDDDWEAVEVAVAALSPKKKKNSKAKKAAQK